MLRVYITNSGKELFHSRIWTSNIYPHICVLESINIKRKFFNLEKIENLNNETEEKLDRIITLINLDTSHVIYKDQDIELRVEVDDEHWYYMNEFTK